MSLKLIQYNDSLKDSLFGFTAECFLDTGKVFEPDGRHSYYRNIPDTFQLFLCLVEDNKVKGSVAIKQFSSDTAELKALYLSKELRGKGWGYKLLDCAVSFARENGYKRIVLDSMNAYEDARRLYDRYGFKEISRYNDNLFAEVFMELIL